VSFFTYERGRHVDPKLDRQRRKEREQLRSFLLRSLVQDAYAQVEERVREVDDLLSLKADAERCHRQVYLFLDQLSDHAVPLAVDESAVETIVDYLDGIRKVADPGNLLEHLHAEAAVLFVANIGLIVEGLFLYDVGRL